MIIWESHFYNHLVFMNLNISCLSHTEFSYFKRSESLIPNFSYWVFDLIQTLDFPFFYLLHNLKEKNQYFPRNIVAFYKLLRLISAVFCADSKNLREKKKKELHGNLLIQMPIFHNFLEWSYKVTVVKLVLLTNGIGSS